MNYTGSLKNFLIGFLVLFFVQSLSLSELGFLRFAYAQFLNCLGVDEHSPCNADPNYGLIPEFLLPQEKYTPFEDEDLFEYEEIGKDDPVYRHLFGPKCGGRGCHEVPWQNPNDHWIEFHDKPYEFYHPED